MTAKVTATSGGQWHMINPPNKRGAYVDGHQQTHKAEPLAHWKREELIDSIQVRGYFSQYDAFI